MNLDDVKDEIAQELRRSDIVIQYGSDAIAVLAERIAIRIGTFMHVDLEREPEPESRDYIVLLVDGTSHTYRAVDADQARSFVPAPDEEVVYVVLDPAQFPDSDAWQRAERDERRRAYSRV